MFCTVMSTAEHPQGKARSRHEEEEPEMPHLSDYYSACDTSGDDDDDDDKRRKKKRKKQKRKKQKTEQEEEEKEAKPQRARQPQASKDYWLLSEAEVAKNAMKDWLRDKSCRFEPGDFELIRHEHADEDADPHRGKILVGCTKCHAHYNEVKPKACPGRSFAWATNVGCFGRKVN